MLRTQPWKLAAIGAMTVVGGIALLSADWSVEQLVAFLAMFFVSRGTVHLAVTPGWVGLSGAISALYGGGEIAVGLVLLVWPDPTQFVLVVVAGSWVILYGIVAATIAVTTRAEELRGLVPLAAAVVDIALGVALLARHGATISSIATLIAALAIAQGVAEVCVAATRKRATRTSPARPAAA